MQSLIIVGNNAQELKNKALEIAKENKISKFDVEIITTEKAVGIGDIRNLRKNLFLKPLEGDKKAVILESFYGATIEAQNAFLKVLEEPPLSTVILILSTSLDFFLPTVLSRCKVINLEKTKKLTKEEISQNLEILNSLEKNHISNALVIAQNYSKDRETALDFLESLIISVHQNLGNDKKLGRVLKKLQKTHTIIKTTNVNVRFALENLFLNL